jgi:hypothetical protein
MAEFDKQIESVKMVNAKEEREKLRKELERASTRFLEDQKAIINPETPAKERRSDIRQIRSNLYFGDIPALLEYLQNCTDAKTQVTLLEALGWHRLAWNADEIAKVAKSMSSNESLPVEVRREALKTFNRISQ